MKSRVGQYYYVLHRGRFVIYICTYDDGNTSTGERVSQEPLFFNREDARKRVYELNGWKYTPKQIRA